MELTLGVMFAIIGLAVLIILPTLYSIVITVLFLKANRDYTDLEKSYNKLGETAEKMQSILEAQGKSSTSVARSKTIKCGFAVPEKEEKDNGNEKG